MELQDKNPAMMTLISLGISVAYFYSAFVFLSNQFSAHNMHQMDFFWELATLILIMLLGHAIEMNAISNAGNALQSIAELLPKTAWLLDANKNTTEIRLQDVKSGDHLLIKVGDKIPADGIILSGQSAVDESLITGESKLVAKKTHDQVIGGSVNGAGTMTMKVTHTGESGFLAQVMQLVSSAQQDKSRVEMLSDKVAKWLFYAALIVGIIAFIAWFVISNNIDTALERLVTVLIIACPHALGLAVPLVIARSTSLAASHGLLIKNKQVLEVAQQVNVVMMDKTGTLTEGKFTVSEYQSTSEKYSDEDILRLMAALEKKCQSSLSDRHSG